MRIIDIAWRLRAHEAVAVAALRREKCVMLRGAPIEYLNGAVGVEMDYVSGAQILEMRCSNNRREIRTAHLDFCR
jgi:hypothetical protein